jgi:hypothetical protein
MLVFSSLCVVPTIRKPELEELREAGWKLYGSRVKGSSATVTVEKVDMKLCNRKAPPSRSRKSLRQTVLTVNSYSSGSGMSL